MGDETRGAGMKGGREKSFFFKLFFTHAETPLMLRFVL
jgi:ribosomal protein L15